MAPAISVVIPTYNRARQLERLLRALKEQERVDGGYEVVVVDDGSTDDTGEVVATHPDVRYEKQENAGPASARNRGWQVAQAPIVAFTDDDTLPGRRWLVELLDGIEGFDAVGGRVDPMDDGFMSSFVQLEQLASHGTDGDDIRYLVTANCAWRASMLEQLGGFSDAFRAAAGEDTDLTLRAIAAGARMRVLDGATVQHEHHTGLRDLLHVYRKHGRSRHAVVIRNPEAGWGERRRQVLGLRYWAGRFSRYRSAGCSVPRSTAYVLMRVVGLLAYAVGVLEGERAARSVVPR